jgi:hypothetical protein
MKFPAVADLMIAVLQGRRYAREQRGKPRLAINERPRHEIFAVEVQEIEQKENEAGGVAGVRCQLDRLNDVMPSGPTPHSSPSR